mmetsp:Transcript_40820/g.117262  ORF Transcript_40820/g.117262 Transcript_40820/m.117262 type:complete len:305 (-) Transcript_40820:176-1090(-)
MTAVSTCNFSGNREISGMPAEGSTTTPNTSVSNNIDQTCSVNNTPNFQNFPVMVSGRISGYATSMEWSHKGVSARGSWWCALFLDPARPPMTCELSNFDADTGLPPPELGGGPPAESGFRTRFCGPIQRARKCIFKGKESRSGRSFSKPTSNSTPVRSVRTKKSCSRSMLSFSSFVSKMPGHTSLYCNNMVICVPFRRDEMDGSLHTDSAPVEKNGKAGNNCSFDPVVNGAWHRIRNGKRSACGSGSVGSRCRTSTPRRSVKQMRRTSNTPRSTILLCNAPRQSKWKGISTVLLGNRTRSPSCN